MLLRRALARSAALALRRRVFSAAPAAAAAAPGKRAVVVAHGDGIGPEIMGATLRVLDAAGAQLETHEIKIGHAVYERGHTSGIEPGAWDVVRDSGVLLKAPITTPSGGGYKSLNVTLRKTLGLFANVRPCVAYAPFVPTRHPGMDVVIVRENEEDLYAGIEHRQTHDVIQCLKIMSYPGTERLVRFAFEHARATGRKRLTCMTKDNIMKLTDGMFHKMFDEVAREYPDLKADHMIIDIGAARLAAAPERFDVVVVPNLYGDIVSDIAAEVAGSVGLAGSANIGARCAMFEAIHGSAPDIAGRDIANPSGLLLGAVQMLVHIGQYDVAARVHNAFLRTLEDGVATRDFATNSSSAGAAGTDTAPRSIVGTAGMADAIIARLGQLPQRLTAVSYGATNAEASRAAVEAAATADSHSAAAPTGSTRGAHTRAVKLTTGIDLFVQWPGQLAGELAGRVKAAIAAGSDDPRAPLRDVELRVITNRGVKVWPDQMPETLCTDHWRCRLLARDGSQLSHAQIAHLLSRAADAGIDFIKTEHLCTFDGQLGYTLAQGQ